MLTCLVLGCILPAHAISVRGVSREKFENVQIEQRMKEEHVPVPVTAMSTSPAVAAGT